MAWSILTVVGMIAAFCIGREYGKPNLVKPDLNRIRGYRRW